MKKLLAVLLIATLALTIVGCAEVDPNAPTNGEQTTTTTLTYTFADLGISFHFFRTLPPSGYGEIIFALTQNSHT